MEGTRNEGEDEDGGARRSKGEREETSESRRIRHGGFHPTGFPRTRASPYPISFPRQFPSVNSIIYRYTPHPRGSTSTAADAAAAISDSRRPLSSRRHRRHRRRRRHRHRSSTFLLPRPRSKQDPEARYGLTDF